MIENNSPRAVTITPLADPWTDAWGKEIGGAIKFDPPSLKLEVCESREVSAQVEVGELLEGGSAYFTWIRLEGSRAKPISVSLHVEPANEADHFVHADPWRPDCRDSIEVRHEPERDDPCCSHSHPHRCHEDRCHEEFMRPAIFPWAFVPFICAPWQDFRRGWMKSERYCR